MQAGPLSRPPHSVCVVIGASGDHREVLLGVSFPSATLDYYYELQRRIM